MKSEQISPALALQRYLMASYLYYHKDKSIITDEEYDSMAKFILENYDNFKHRHKHLVTKDDLVAGTLFTLKEENYPSIVKEAAKAWAAII